MFKLIHFLHLLGRAFKLVCGLWKKPQPGCHRVAHIKWCVFDDDGRSASQSYRIDELWSLDE